MHIYFLLSNQSSNQIKTIIQIIFLRKKHSTIQSKPLITFPLFLFSWNEFEIIITTVVTTQTLDRTNPHKLFSEKPIKLVYCQLKFTFDTVANVYLTYFFFRHLKKNYAATEDHHTAGVVFEIVENPLSVVRKLNFNKTLNSRSCFNYPAPVNVA